MRENKPSGELPLNALAAAYDELYGSHAETFGGGKPEILVDKIPGLVEPGSVFELAPGDGRNALWLAEQGFNVTAIDISQVGIKKLADAAAEKGLSITAEVSDIEARGITSEHIAIVCTYMLHHLPRENAIALVQSMKQHTQPGGVNVVGVFTNQGDFFNANPETPNFYPTPDELAELYSDWNIIQRHTEERETRSDRKDGTGMKNHVAVLLAQKPTS